MAKPTVEDLARGVAEALGGRLVSLLLYGSAARGARRAGRADVNTLLICDRVDEALFAALEPAIRAWTRAGHPAPLIFTEEEWRSSSDAFPIEYAEIRQAHRVLAGRDPWAGVSVQREHLRRQLEVELMGKLVRLRQGYATTRGDGKRLGQLVAGSARGVFTMLRTVLRLSERPVPETLEGVARAAAALIGFPPDALDDVVAELGDGRRLALGPADPRAAVYLGVLAKTAEYVNRMS